jgi:hypothetical protein
MTMGDMLQAHFRGISPLKDLTEGRVRFGMVRDREPSPPAQNRTKNLRILYAATSENYAFFIRGSV